MNDVWTSRAAALQQLDNLDRHTQLAGNPAVGMRSGAEPCIQANLLTQLPARAWTGKAPGEHPAQTQRRHTYRGLVAPVWSAEVWYKHSSALGRVSAPVPWMSLLLSALALNQSGAIVVDDVEPPAEYSSAGELARRIMGGETAAQTEFVEKYYAWLLMIVRRKFPGRSWHEDIVQDAFLVAILGLVNATIHNPDAITAFLRGSAFNIGYGYLRKDGRQDFVDPEILDTVIDARQNVAEAVSWEDMVRFARELIQELDVKRDRRILLMFCLENRDKDEVCEKLDLTSSRFDGVLHRARKRLQKLVDERNDDPSDEKQAPKKGRAISDGGFEGSTISIFLMGLGGLAAYLGGML